ncbi:methyltransferase regulatory domain-containing protein [Pusillimonas minor]|uniref:Methyltransferase regulatory domain-containing protein n=1 Tax=Pusillimonas minor TaxID=2697024 RepID=A0A842HUS1_9BURK|nr:class I SAM-dependent methyltransferase [Pusillimonas minor]MBC2771190.1 methyltransferase regulatory domain-containing protein [Pusillimonas minor]
MNMPPEDVNQQIADHYDRSQYTSNAFYYASPGHIRAAAHLYGVDTVPIEKARVLELGCAAGGNLLPFAVAYPEATVVGVDLSSGQIGQGQQVVNELGLKNMTLHAMSLADITPEFGEFDYIIAHGVFSWVPHDVQQAMLRICKENLSPKGVAYISYNTYPGWKAGDIVRDAMMLNSYGAENDEEKLARAKAMLTLLSDGLAVSNPLAPSLRGAVNQLRKFSDYYITHEYLEAFNTPCYFVEFVSLADQNGLAYVGDAEPQSELGAAFGQNVQLTHSMVALGQPKALRQQYLDFAVGRNFRKSLLVRADNADTITKDPELDRVPHLRWAGFFQSANNDNTPAGAQAYTNHAGRNVTTKDAMVVALINTLSEAWPRSLAFNNLCATDAIRSAAGNNNTEAALTTALQTMFKLGMLRYTLEPGPYDQPNSNTVLVPGFAQLTQRLQQDAQFPLGRYNLWHTGINLKLNPAELFVIAQMQKGGTENQWAMALRDALTAGKVPDANGEYLTGQRNLDAKALLIVSRLKDLLRRQGVWLGS